jgi:translation initiation factor 1
MSKNTRLVYSTDSRENEVCPKCKELKPECTCGPELKVSANYTVIFRIEKGGRGGKTVTVMDGFPRHETLLKDLTKEFKSKCGTGGTYVLSSNSGLIEIQGDKREKIKKLLTAKGIKFKGV